MNRLSVVIPAYNAADTLGECLGSLALGVARPNEILVVDDGSSAEQSRRIAALVEEHGGRSIRQPNQGPAAARNRGARESTGDILVFLDADVRVHPSTIGQLAAAFADPQLDAVFGSYDDQPGGNTVVSDFRNLLHHFVHQGSRRQASTFWAGCGAVRRSIFSQTGFDESYTGASIEDVAFGLKLTAAGHRIESRPEIQVTHLKCWTLKSFLSTDLFSRAIPWTRMMLSGDGGLPSDLHFGFAQRASTLLAGSLPLFLLLAIRLPWHGLAGAGLCLVMLALLNRQFLGFLAKRRGVGFALQAFPLHIAHYFAGGLGLVAGCLAEWRHRDRHAFLAAAIIAAVSFGIQWGSGAYHADFGGHPDEPGHFVGGVLVAQYWEHPTPASPMAFAEAFYLHFPRFAIGHWPPGFYLLEGLWFTFLGGTRATALLLQAGIAFLLATLVYAVIRARTSTIPALGGALLLLWSKPMQGALGMTMADSLTALVVLGASLAFAYYLARPNPARSLTFGLLAAAGMLTKGSAVPVLLVPALAILFTRRWNLLARRDLWICALPVLLLAGPWYAFARRFDSPNHSSLFVPRPLLEGLSAWFEYPAVMLLLAVVGILVGVLMLTKRDPSVAALLALVTGYVAMPLLVPHFNEGRHLMPGAAGAAILAGWALGRAPGKAPSFVTGLALLSLLVLGGSFIRYPAAVFRPWVWHLASESRRGERVMLAGRPDGMIVAAMAEHHPRSGPIVLRSSRVLARSDWNGHRYSTQLRDAQQTRQRLRELGIGLIVMPTAPELLHEQLLADVTRNWVERPGPAGMRFFLAPEPPELHPIEIEQRRLGHRIRSGKD